MVDFEKYQQLNVNEIEELVRSYRVRCNDVHAIKKVFYTELEGESGIGT